MSGVDFAASYETYLASVRQRYDRLMEEAAARLRAAGLTVRAKIIDDAVSVADGLVGAVRQTDAQVLVVGTHGRTGLDRALLGSVAEKLVRLCPSAVLTVRTNISEEA